MSQLSRGQKIKLADLTSSSTLRIALATAPGLQFDFCCFGLNENGKLADESNFIFYNQRASPNRAIEIVGERAGEAMTFAVDLPRLPTNIRRIVFTMVVDGTGTMADLKSGQWSVLAAGVEIARFNFAGADFGAEKSLIVGEIYFYGGEWRVAAVAQGFRGGLNALLKHYGGEAQIENAPQKTVSSAPESVIAAPLLSSGASTTQTKRCIRCGVTESSPKNRGEANRHCAACESEIKSAFARLRADFGRAWHSGTLNNAQWDQMWQRFETVRTGATRAQALDWLRPEALRAVERLVVMATSDGKVAPESDSYIRQICAALALPAALQKPFLNRLDYLHQIAAIRRGQLPSASAGDIHLESSEICHFYVPTTYHKTTARGINSVDGHLMATSKKLFFLSDIGGKTIQFRNIMRVEEDTNSIHLNLSTSGGHGRYSVEDPHLCEAILTTLTRQMKRQMLSTGSDKPSRHIPQDVKTAVWQRDGGRCAQCGAENYLEFDHIIPFSKGGANTFDNVQLLCRKCNSEKGDKI